MTKKYNAQYLLDTEINQMLKDLYSEARDSFNTVTPALLQKVRQVDWDKVKTDTIHITAKSSAFCYVQFKKVDWIEVFEILVAGILVLVRGTYLAGLYTGKAMYWLNDQISAAVKKDWRPLWYEIREESMTKFQLAKEYVQDQGVKMLLSILQPPTPPTSGPTTADPTAPSTPTPDANTEAEHQGNQDQNEGIQAGESDDADGSDDYSEQLEDLSVEDSTEELDTQAMEQENAEVISQTAYHQNQAMMESMDDIKYEPVIRNREEELERAMKIPGYQEARIQAHEEIMEEIAQHQHQAMMESMDDLDNLVGDLENIVDSICTPVGQHTNSQYEIYKNMTVRELRRIAGVFSKKYNKETLIVMAMNAQTA